jgi:hypothetical protein
MKSVSIMVAMALMASAVLSGCVIVPHGGWYGHGYGRGGYHHHPGPRPYRGR